MDINSLIKYFSGESTNPEREEIGNWLAQKESHRDLFIKARIQYDASLLVESPKIEKKIKVNKTLKISGLIKYAASIAVIGGLFSLYSHYKDNQLYSTYQSVTAPAGNRSCIELPDGTTVWINANSTIKYPLAFSQKERTIFLSGEAYFEVEKGSVPFIVKTDKYDVEVLGTTFTVESYPKEASFKTTLLNGKVKLYNAECLNPTYLNAGETAELIDKNLVVAPTKYTNNYRWIDGLIFIESKSFVEIMELFEKFYDVDIRISNNQVRDLGYRGKLRVSDGVDHALRVLQKDYHFKYEREEGSNIIYIN